MSNFTTQVRWLMETNYNFELDEYPIFDENYRNVLNNKILNHYKFYEIGFETAGLWKAQLKTKLNEIMPYYNQLYNSQLIKFDPLSNVNLTENFERKTEGETTGNSKSESQSNSNAENNGKHIFNETPQGNISQTDIDNQQYATTLNLDKDTANTTNTMNDTTNNQSNVTSLEDYIKTIKGNNGNNSNSSLLNEFRTTFINIDMQIIDELKDLFMGLWQ